ncbi:MAG: hypothetical protein WAV54_13800 [Acidimicrobiales bacterium]
MTIAVQQDFKGVTLAQYDEAIAKMGISPGGPHSEPGLLFHFVTATDDGFRVTDVWKTREGFERFAQEKIGPISRELGFSTAPSVEYLDVHNFNTAG